MTPFPQSGSSSAGQVTAETARKNPTLLQKFTQQRDDAKLLAWANEQYARMKSDRVTIERQWYINLAFYFGKQYVQYLTTSSSNNTFALNTPKAPPWRVRMVVNKIRPVMRHEMSRLTSQRPMFTVVPSTTEDEDYSAARVGESIFKSVYSDKKVAKIIKQTVWWEVITGCGYLKSFWDSNKYDPITQQKGDIVIERVSPFHVFVPDLLEEEIESQPFICHASTKSADWIKQRYGITVNPNSTAAKDILEDSFLNLTGTSNQKKDSVLCLEYWIKPGGHPDFPEGGLFSVIGDKLVRQAPEFPYAHAEYPFYKIDGVPSGKFYADSIIVDLLPLQREYNRTKSQIIEAKNIMAKPRLLAPRGSINPRQITTEPGQTILYTPGYEAPRPLPMDSLPPFVLEELDRLQSDIDDISAQHEITRGGTPSQVTAATAISYLQEQDDSKLAYQTASIEWAVEKLGRHILKYATQFWTTPRLVRVVGTDGAFEAHHWQANDLKGNTDLRVEAGSALPQSKAAKQAFVMDLIKLGVIEAPVGLEMLDIGGVEKIYEDFLIDKRQAQRENLKMAKVGPELIAMAMQSNLDPETMQPTNEGLDPNIINELAPVNTWDNHQAHIQFHNQYRKSQDFDMLPPEVKQLFEQHVVMHQYALQGMTPMLAGGEMGPSPLGGDPNADPNAEPNSVGANPSGPNSGSTPPPGQEQPPQPPPPTPPANKQPNQFNS